MRAHGLVLLVFFGSLLATLGATAQTPMDDVGQLRARLENLGRQNAELRPLVLERTPPVVPAHPVSASRREQGASSEHIKSLVDQYLEEKEAAREVEEQRKRAEAADKEHEIGSDLEMRAKWNNGLELSTKNKDFRVHVGGRTQFDVGWFSTAEDVQQNINVPYADGVDFRRARLRVDGTMYEVIEWACEYDFVNAIRVRNAAGTATSDTDVTALTDMWLQFKELPLVGNCRIGNQKEAIGFEHLVSSRYLPFMERSYNQDSFYGGTFNGFTPGVAFFHNWGADDMGSWNVGVYKPVNNVFAFNATDGDYAVTGRLTRLLSYVDEGRGLLHVGVSGRQATTVADQTIFRTRDAIRTGVGTAWPVPASTGVLFGDDEQFLNGELAAVCGPWTLQGEYLVSGLQDARGLANDPQGNNVRYHGGYLQILYFLTGEHDHYNKKTAVFERPKPNENFFLVRDGAGGFCHGPGAWQVGARYNYLDLNDGGIDGGILHNLTAGLNWFWNPNSKMQFNYMATHRDAALVGDLGDGWIHGWGMRLAFDF